MSIIKTRKSREFVAIDNKIITNTDLNDEGYRLLTYLLSKPENWVVYNNEVIKTLQKTDHWLQKAFKNLKQFGYLKRTQFHKNGKYEWVTEVSDLPEFLESKTNLADSQPIVFQPLVIQGVETQPIYKEITIQKKNEVKKNEDTQKQVFTSQNHIDEMVKFCNQFNDYDFAKTFALGILVKKSNEVFWNEAFQLFVKNELEDIIAWFKANPKKCKTEPNSELRFKNWIKKNIQRKNCYDWVQKTSQNDKEIAENKVLEAQTKDDIQNTKTAIKELKIGKSNEEIEIYAKEFWSIAKNVLMFGKFDIDLMSALKLKSDIDQNKVGVMNGILSNYCDKTKKYILKQLDLIISTKILEQKEKDKEKLEAKRQIAKEINNL